ncbi:MAG: hypothetical protein LW878_10980 [Proteobacteria bacterium]|nr:hypothetical protein [Pseudomonadota bacterium]
MSKDINGSSDTTFPSLAQLQPDAAVNPSLEPTHDDDDILRVNTILVSSSSIGTPETLVTAEVTVKGGKGWYRANITLDLVFARVAFDATRLTKMWERLNGGPMEAVSTGTTSTLHFSQPRQAIVPFNRGNQDKEVERKRRKKLARHYIWVHKSSPTQPSPTEELIRTAIKEEYYEDEKVAISKAGNQDSLMLACQDPKIANDILRVLREKGWECNRAASAGETRDAALQVGYHCCSSSENAPTAPRDIADMFKEYLETCDVDVKSCSYFLGENGSSYGYCEVFRHEVRERIEDMAGADELGQIRVNPASRRGFDCTFEFKDKRNPPPAFNLLLVKANIDFDQATVLFSASNQKGTRTRSPVAIHPHSNGRYRLVEFTKYSDVLYYSYEFYPVKDGYNTILGAPLSAERALFDYIKSAQSILVGEVNALANAANNMLRNQKREIEEVRDDNRALSRKLDGLTDIVADHIFRQETINRNVNARINLINTKTTAINAGVFGLQQCLLNSSSPQDANSFLTGSLNYTSNIRAFDAQLQALSIELDQLGGRDQGYIEDGPRNKRTRDSDREEPNKRARIEMDVEEDPVTSLVESEPASPDASFQGETQEEEQAVNWGEPVTEEDRGSPPLAGQLQQAPQSHQLQHNSVTNEQLRNPGLQLGRPTNQSRPQQGAAQGTTQKTNTQQANRAEQGRVQNQGEQHLQAPQIPQAQQAPHQPPSSGPQNGGLGYPIGFPVSAIQEAIQGLLTTREAPHPASPQIQQQARHQEVSPSFQLSTPSRGPKVPSPAQISNANEAQAPTGARGSLVVRLPAPPTQNSQPTTPQRAPTPGPSSTARGQNLPNSPRGRGGAAPTGTRGGGLRGRPSSPPTRSQGSNPQSPAMYNGAEEENK